MSENWLINQFINVFKCKSSNFFTSDSIRVQIFFKFQWFWSISVSYNDVDDVTNVVKHLFQDVSMCCVWVVNKSTKNQNQIDYVRINLHYSVH